MIYNYIFRLTVVSGETIRNKKGLKQLVTKKIWMQKKEQIDILYINKHLTDKMIITLYLKNKLVTKKLAFCTVENARGVASLYGVVLWKNDVFTCLIKVESIKTKCAKS